MSFGLFGDRFKCGLLIGFIFLVAGCTRLGVAHLHPEPFVMDAQQDVVMRYWRFEYTAEPMREGIGLRCRAFLEGEPVPAGMSWIETLHFSVYLSDSTGTVLSRAEVDLPPRPLDRADVCGIPFDVILAPEPASCGPLRVAFGYRTALTPDRLDLSRDTVFFFEESAVKQ